MYKAIVFDLDGTLVDSPLCFQTIRAALGIPKGEYILEFLEGLDPAIRAEKLMRLEEIEFEAAKSAAPFPHVLALLNELRAARIRLGIFTRNCRKATDHVVRTHKLEVDLIITREDAAPKPDPEGLHRFLSLWNLQAEELLFVGDFQFDIECGKKAGVKTALFTNGMKEIPDWRPDHVVECFSEFNRILAA